MTRANLTRFTIRCKPDDLMLAASAAEYGVSEMPYKDAMLGFDDGTDFYVKRTRAGGISVVQIGSRS